MKMFSLRILTLILIVTVLVACGAATPEPVEEAAVEPTAVAEQPPTEEPEPTAEPEKPEEESSVRLGMNQELEFLNVMYTQGGNSLQASKTAQRGLLFLDPEGNWIGELALEVPTIENGLVTEDGMHITFNLREGVTFHDGSPVTSADVKATWEAIMNPDNTPITRAGYDKIESIDTLDDYTVTINFSEPYPSWKILFDFVLPKHVIEKNSPGLDESQAMREPIGFGPYKIVQWKTGEFIEYEAFEDYWQGAPAIDRFFIVIYPSTEALLAALEAGEVDIAWGLRPANVPAIQALEPDVSLVTAPVPGQERYVMNGDASLAPLFANRELRVALQQAVDKQTIIDNILHGYAEPAISSWSGSPWENPDLVPHEFDPEKSREILEELGWRDEDGDGIREAHGVEGLEDGTPLSFKHATTSGVLQREQVQLLVQQMFKDVGVDMVIENRRTAELFGTWDQGGVWSHGEYEMGGWSHGLRLPDPDISIRFLCSEIASEENPTGAQWHHYCNPEVDELLQAFQTEVDETKRIDLLYQAQAIMHDDAYNIYLFMSPQIYAVNSALNNFELTPFTRWYGNIHNWEWQ